jgi:Uma2 family endonuclease
MVTLQLRQIKVLPGCRVDLADVDWPEFQAILEELGDGRSTRIAYNNKTLTIVAPLFEHESDKVALGDLVKALLEELAINYVASASTTLKRKDLGKGVEPDDSFYIQNVAQVLGKKRLDLSVDPPPDLAIEIDLTSKTEVGVYELLGVPELWRFDGGHLQIYALQTGKYSQVKESPTFPGWSVIEMAQRYVARAREVGQGIAIRELREWVRANSPSR